MENVLLVVHLIIAVAMILLILIQRNAQDGGGLLGSGGGTMGGMFTARGSANVLSRTTAFLAIAFIVTSLLLTVLANQGNQHDRSLVSQIPTLTKPVDGTAPNAPNTVPVVPMNAGAPVVAPVPPPAPVPAPVVNSLAAPVVMPVVPEGINAAGTVSAPVVAPVAPSAVPSVPLSK